MPKGGLSYDSREACIMDARRKGVSTTPCNNLPASRNKRGGQNSASLMQPKRGGAKSGGVKKQGGTSRILPPEPAYP